VEGAQSPVEAARVSCRGRGHLGIEEEEEAEEDEEE